MPVRSTASRTTLEMCATGWWAVKYVFIGVWIIFTVAAGQNFKDHPLVCEDGYKVSSIKRGIAEGKNVGSLTVECERLISAVRNPTCKKSSSPYVCNGTVEACHSDSWIGGFIGYELDVGGALLYPPNIDDVKVIEQTCKSVTLNVAGGDFDRSIKRNQLFHSLKCWRQQDLNGVLQDFVWQPSVCEFALSGGRPNRDGSQCSECNCDCGPFACPDGGVHRRPFKLIHKRLNLSTCQCRCDCIYKCM
uniref:4Fe-4S ferredoxin-type domain-containing protein n=1 Tax=Plectus sambesii TaxID=2011161 RepID=A0A914W9F7_9BILA